jgi:probable biosynthetic protein (TIGR04098 family)
MLRQILHEEIPGLCDLSIPLSDQAIDSFGLVVLRLRVEQAIGRQINDDVWTSIRTPADILSIMVPAEPGERHAPTSSFGETRQHFVNMPQMAIGGLSESWLLKELGDLHWSMITAGLRSTSSGICDGSGERLYATFTRVSYHIPGSLRTFRENDQLAMRGTITRSGAGLFTSNIDIDLRDLTAEARLMSSFSRRGGPSNTGLLKGQPDIPPDCAIPETGRTRFATEYRDQRSATLARPLFQCEYEINPFYDINGVNLLYFASYPIISDSCALRHDRDLASRYATRSRDVFYFANTNTDEGLVFSIHSWQQQADTLEMETSISRSVDGTLMAYLRTEKVRV